MRLSFFYMLQSVAEDLGKDESDVVVKVSNQYISHSVKNYQKYLIESSKLQFILHNVNF